MLPSGRSDSTHTRTGLCPVLAVLGPSQTHRSRGRLRLCLAGSPVARAVSSSLSFRTNLPLPAAPHPALPHHTQYHNLYHYFRLLNFWPKQNFRPRLIYSRIFLRRSTNNRSATLFPVPGSHYIIKGKMWQAFESEEKSVLLIDEIDKADIEFPNDLLLELDKMEFYCYELQKTIKAKNRPIVIITSNNEKELPDAFLRRCFFHFIRFPERQTI